MYTNLQDCFYYYADLLEISGETNRFRLQNYRRLARELENGTPIDRLTKIGQNTLPKIQTYMTTGECPWIEQAEETFSKQEIIAVKTFRSVIGIGPATIRNLLRRNIYNTSDASKSNLLSITQKKSLTYATDISKVFSYTECTKHIEHIESILHCCQVTPVGKYRRKNDKLTEISILLQTKLNMREILQKLTDNNYIKDVYKWGEKKLEAFVILNPKKEYRRLVLYKSTNYPRDLFIYTGPSSFTSKYVIPDEIYHEFNIFSSNNEEYVPPEFRSDKYYKQNKCIWEIILTSKYSIRILNDFTEIADYLVSKNLLLIAKKNSLTLLDLDWNLIDYSFFPTKDFNCQFNILLKSLKKSLLVIYCEKKLVLPSSNISSWKKVNYTEEGNYSEFKNFTFFH